MPSASGTSVDLTQNNFRMVKPNAVGTSSGFSLFGVIPFASPRYSDAMSALYADGGVKSGGAFALANVAQEHSSKYFILFSLPQMTIRADVIEFVDTNVAE